MLGARVIGIASEFKAQALLDLECESVIDRNDPDLEQRVKQAAGGPVDVALDVVGGSMFMPLINSLRQRGWYSTSGAIAGPVVEFDLRQLVYKDIKMTGALKPMLAASYPLRDLAQAQKAFISKRRTGNIVVTME